MGGALLITTACATIIVADFLYGYKWHVKLNKLTEDNITKFAPKNRDNYIQKPKQNNATMVPTAPTKIGPIFLRTLLPFRSWLLEYFYKTRINFYINGIIRAWNRLFNQRQSVNGDILGQLIINNPGLLTTIDPPNLLRHRFALNALKIKDSEMQNIVFFSDYNFMLPYYGDKELIDLIEVCCRLESDDKCTAIYWRIKSEKLGHLKKNDISIESFTAIVVAWISARSHPLIHCYGEGTILSDSKNSSIPLNQEQKCIENDMKKAMHSLVALNHVGVSAAALYGISMETLLSILIYNVSSNAVWKHAKVINELLCGFRLPKFMIKARNELLKLFIENKLFSKYNFEAIFLSIVCHGFDHYSLDIVKDCHLRANEVMGMPDLAYFVTLVARQNKPIIQESRLKYSAESKMFKKYAKYLKTIDAKLTDHVYLINLT